ncbi:SNARE associated Golgi family protein, partial [Gilliamella apis SCGC AB-598-P17]
GGISPEQVIAANGTTVSAVSGSGVSLSLSKENTQHWAIEVFIGRFFGPLRAIVPLIAGTMHMSTSKFNLANIASAPVWAFVLLAPGAFGVPWLETLFG